MSIKPQANFYNLKRAGEKMNFPFTAQVLPTKLINEFRDNVHHKVTFLSKEILLQRVHIKRGDCQEFSFPLTDIDVRCIYLNNDVTYNKVGDVLRCRKRDDINFLTVMSKCEFKDQVLGIGDVLYLQPSMKFLEKNILKCIAFPGNRKLSLPDTLSIELRKCSDPRNIKTEKLTDLLFSGNLPCLITFPKDFEGVDNKGYALARESVLLDGYSTGEILLACKKNQSNDRVEIHSLPAGMDIDIEILHGDTPVAEFTNNQLKSIMKCIKKEKNLEFEHKKFSIDELKLNLCDYDYSNEFDDSDDEVVYENARNSGYEYPDISSLKIHRDMTDSKAYKSLEMNSIRDRPGYECNVLSHLAQKGMTDLNAYKSLRMNAIQDFSGYESSDKIVSPLVNRNMTDSKATERLTKNTMESSWKNSKIQECQEHEYITPVEQYVDDSALDSKREQTTYAEKRGFYITPLEDTEECTNGSYQQKNLEIPGYIKMSTQDNGQIVNRSDMKNKLNSKKDYVEMMSEQDTIELEQAFHDHHIEDNRNLKESQLYYTNQNGQNNNWDRTKEETKGFTGYEVTHIDLKVGYEEEAPALPVKKRNYSKVFTMTH